MPDCRSAITNVRLKMRETRELNVPGFLVTIFHNREYQRGWRQQGKYVKTNTQKTASLIVVK